MFCPHCWANLPDGCSSCRLCRRAIPISSAGSPRTTVPAPTSLSIRTDRPRRRLSWAIGIAGLIILTGWWSWSGHAPTGAEQATRQDPAPPIASEPGMVSSEETLLGPTGRFDPAAPSTITLDSLDADSNDLKDVLNQATQALAARDYPQAARLFASLQSQHMEHAELRRAVIETYGRWGWDQVSRGQYEEAIVTFQHGLEAGGEDGRLFGGRGYALSQLHRDDEAIEALTRAAALDPSDLRARQLLGELYYRRNDLDQALAMFRAAQALAPGNEALSAQVARLQREAREQAPFIRAVTRHFTLQFDGEENRDLYRTVLEILESAYGEVGRALNHFPSDAVDVVLYTGRQFQDITRSPSWTGALYDGKIRVPTDGYQTRPEVLRRVLYHEYVHALIHAMTRQAMGGPTGLPAPQVPTWLHEGLAQYFEGAPATDGAEQALRSLARRDAMIPLSYLEGSFMSLSSAQAAVAYAESRSAVAYLIDRYGMARITQLLDALSRHASIDAACREAFAVPYDRVQQLWIDVVAAN